MSLTTVSPEKAKQLLDTDSILVDIREPDEHAREKILGARHLPLSKLEEMELPVHQGRAILFHCKSGARTRTNASRLARKVDESCDALSSKVGSMP